MAGAGTPARQRPPSRQLVERELIRSAEQERQRALEKELEELAPLRDELQRWVSEAPNEFDRLARALWAFSGGDQTAILCDQDALMTLFPQFWPERDTISLGAEPPWNREAVVKWFLTSVRARPGKVSRTKGRVFGSKRKMTPGWWFRSGSTYSGELDGRTFPEINLTTRGRLLGFDGRKARPDQNFNALALRDMAFLCGLCGPRDRFPSLRERVAGRAPKSPLENGSWVWAL